MEIYIACIVVIIIILLLVIPTSMSNMRSENYVEKPSDVIYGLHKPDIYSIPSPYGDGEYGVENIRLRHNPGLYIESVKSKNLAEMEVEPTQQFIHYESNNGNYPPRSLTQERNLYSNEQKKEINTDVVGPSGDDNIFNRIMIK